MIHPFSSYAIADFAPQYASDAARLHVAGQPGTFLTALGVDVLAIIYRALPETAAGFGVVAVDDAFRVLGFASATTSTGSLFVSVALQYGADLFRALAAAALRNPALVGRMAATVAYPFQVAQAENVRTAELLSIMVTPEARGMGVGGALLDALVTLAQERNVQLLDVTVDSANAGARRFYAAHGFAPQQEFMLYGRPMCQYIGAVPRGPHSKSGVSPTTTMSADANATVPSVTGTPTDETSVAGTLATHTPKAPPAA